MRAEDVILIYRRLLERGAQIWVDGGWGIDALLGAQTREHKDLDALLRLEDLPRAAAAMVEMGFRLKELWPENRWAPSPLPIPLVGRAEPRTEAATAFVMMDDHGREIDAKVFQLDAEGRGIPAWQCEFVFPPGAFDGQGVILGTPVRCLSAEVQMATHTGYTLQAKDIQDLRNLHSRFGIPYPPEHAAILQNTPDI